MKKLVLSTWQMIFFSAIVSILTVFPSWASGIQGEITNVDARSISGWAWNKENTNDIQKVEIHICQADNPNPIKYIHADANDYRDDLVSKLKDGWHGFSVPVNWSELSGNEFKIQAYAVKDDKFYILGDMVYYNKSSGTYSKRNKTSDNSSVSIIDSNPSSKSAAKAAQSVNSAEKASANSFSAKEKSLGVFIISGYCSCQECGSGLGLTFSGTAPQSNHTIAADLTILPLGTKVRIGSTIYTVEDKGSNIEGNRIDIYYDDHETAAGHGIQKQEVFLIQ